MIAEFDYIEICEYFLRPREQTASINFSLGIIESGDDKRENKKEMKKKHWIHAHKYATSAARVSGACLSNSIG